MKIERDTTLACRECLMTGKGAVLAVGKLTIGGEDRIFLCRDHLAELHVTVKWFLALEVPGKG